MPFAPSRGSYVAPPRAHDAATFEALQREIERLRAITANDRDGLLAAILEHSPHGIMVADREGRLVLQSAMAEHIWAGSATAHDATGWGAYKAFHEDGRAYAPEDWGIAKCIATRAPVHAHEVLIQRFDDTRATLLASSSPLVGADGELQGAITVFADVSRVKASENEARRLRHEVDQQSSSLRSFAQRAKRLQSLTSALGRAMSAADVARIVSTDGQQIFGADGALVYFRRAESLVLASVGGIDAERARRYAELSLEQNQPLTDAVRTQTPVWLATRDELLVAYPHLADVALDGRALQAVVALPLQDEGETVGGLAFTFYDPVEFDEVQRDFQLMVAEQTAQAIRRARLFEAERLARAAIQRREERTAIVARAATTIAATLGSRDTIAGLTRMIVPGLADWCAIDEQGPDGSIRRIALYHRDPAKMAIAAALEQKYPERADSKTGVPNVLRTGEREWLGEISDAMIEAGARDREHLALIRQLRLTSYAIVPLVARGRVVGALTLVGEDGRTMSEDDVAAAEELGRHAALALDNARLFEAAEQERARMSALVEATATIVWSARADGQVTEVSPSWLAFTGQRADEYLDGGFLEAIHPEDRAGTMRQWAAAVAARAPYAAEYRLRRADGSYAYTLARGRPYLDRDGAVAGYTGCNVDITSLRRAEREARDHAETLSTLNDLVSNISAELDQHKLVQAVTDAAVAVTGARFGAFFYNVVDDRGGRYLLYTVSGVARAEFAKFPMPRNTEVFAATFGGQGVVRSDDITLDPRYGKNEPYHGMPPGHLPVKSYLAVPVVARSGEVIGGIFLGHEEVGVFDVRAETLASGIAAQAAIGIDNARLYGEAQRLIRALEQSNNDLDRFAYATSHDLKAPLRSIGSLSEWIEEDLGEAASDDLKKNLSLLRGRVRRMESLINGILAYSRIGRTPPKHEEVDVAKLLGDVAELLGLQPPARLEVEPGMPVIATDPTTLQQVFMNLIGNALKHAGRAEVTVRVGVRDLGNDWEFAVADDGPGIAPAFHQRIWGIFQTLQARDRVESTGIGLAMVKKIVEARGGVVRVESDGQHGATFYFTWAKSPTGDGLNAGFRA